MPKRRRIGQPKPVMPAIVFEDEGAALRVTF
jgi:hypothetical protein